MFIMEEKYLEDGIWREIENEYCKKCKLYKHIKNKEEFYECAKCAFRLYISKYFNKDLNYIK